jgi:hypothetical protein
MTNASPQLMQKFGLFDMVRAFRVASRVVAASGR